MPKPDLSVVGKKRGPITFSYTWRDVVLYALGVGAPADDLRFVYENAAGGLKVLPSFAVVASAAGWPDVGDVEHSLFLHGEQTVRLHRPLPAEATIVCEGVVADIFDKGKGALYVVRCSASTEDGSPLADAESAIFYVGAGGFGGERGPSAERVEPPTAVAPDFAITERVAPNQAALYRLCGDLNPLHLDPEAARRGGFDRPILHGLCTYGFAARAAVAGALDGDPDRLREFKARFAGVVYPGDELTTEGWRDGDRWIIRSRTPNGVVLSNGELVAQPA